MRPALLEHQRRSGVPLNAPLAALASLGPPQGSPSAKPAPLDGSRPLQARPCATCAKTGRTCPTTGHQPAFPVDRGRTSRELDKQCARPALPGLSRIRRAHLKRVNPAPRGITRRAPGSPMGEPASAAQSGGPAMQERPRAETAVRENSQTPSTAGARSAQQTASRAITQALTSAGAGLAFAWDTIPGLWAGWPPTTV